MLISLKTSHFRMFRGMNLPRAVPCLFTSLGMTVSRTFVNSIVTRAITSGNNVNCIVLSTDSDFGIPLTFLSLFSLTIVKIILCDFFMILRGHFIR